VKLVLIPTSSTIEAIDRGGLEIRCRSGDSEAERRPELLSWKEVHHSHRHLSGNSIYYELDIVKYTKRMYLEVDLINVNVVMITKVRNLIDIHYVKNNYS
jgi:hypothetical protein